MRRIAHGADLPYRPNDILTNPDYAIQIGMAEFSNYLADWGNSLVLGAAAYNAGPTNVKRWIAAFGDPRTASVDPIDWVEEIPFSETRNYVERVLENTEIYRDRLSGRDEAASLGGYLCAERGACGEDSGAAATAGACRAGTCAQTRPAGKSLSDYAESIQRKIVSHSRASRWASAICEGAISRESCARQVLASSLPRKAARLNHLWAATKSTPTP